MNVFSLLLSGASLVLVSVLVFVPLPVIAIEVFMALDWM